MSGTESISPAKVTLGATATNLLFAAISKNLRGFNFIKQAIEDTRRTAEESIQSAWRFHSSRTIIVGAFAVIERLSAACVKRGFVASEEEAATLILDLLNDSPDDEKHD
jgi:hypothetical protein